LCVGAADWRKTTEGMLSALDRVRRSAGGSEVVMAWAGRLDPPDRARVEQQASERQLGGALRLLGWVPDGDVAALMRGAVALFFVSRIEGFGYPIVEAMACGCPVVGSARPATVEIAGDAMLAVDPERPDAIAGAVATLLRDPDERRRLAERGAARSRDFRLSRMADETLAVYRRVARA
jgi:glycosyltransferase involved in cell wall biosynthesis